jgi:hypothetical protein
VHRFVINQKTGEETRVDAYEFGVKQTLITRLRGLEPRYSGGNVFLLCVAEVTSSRKTCRLNYHLLHANYALGSFMYIYNLIQTYTVFPQPLISSRAFPSLSSFSALSFMYPRLPIFDLVYFSAFLTNVAKNWRIIFVMSIRLNCSHIEPENR